MALLAAGNRVMAAAMPPRQREAGEQPPTKNGRVREASEVPPRCAANAAISATKMGDVLRVKWVVGDMTSLMDVESVETLF